MIRFNKLFKHFTWLGYLNFFVLQWFFIRLAKVKDKDNGKIKYILLYFVVPNTGWHNNYKYVKIKRNK